MINTRKRIGFVSLLLNILAVKKIFGSFVVRGHSSFFQPGDLTKTVLKAFFAALDPDLDLTIIPHHLSFII